MIEHRELQFVPGLNTRFGGDAGGGGEQCAHDHECGRNSHGSLEEVLHGLIRLFLSARSGKSRALTPNRHRGKLDVVWTNGVASAGRAAAGMPTRSITSAKAR